MIRAIVFGLAIIMLHGCAQLSAAPHYRNSDKIAHLGPYTHSVAARGLIFASGTIAHDIDDGFAAPEIEAQTRQAFANLEAALAEQGASLSDIVKMTVYLKTPADMRAMNAVYAEYFPDHPPARTTVPGADWGHPNILIELDAIAVQN